MSKFFFDSKTLIFPPYYGLLPAFAPISGYRYLFPLMRYARHQNNSGKMFQILKKKIPPYHTQYFGQLTTQIGQLPVH